uniref:ATP synthase subunit 9, mitochondrial n=1 Tax=Viscum album TaxID=3972 RepID=A0A0R5ENC0_VISAL|nr:ATP synthase F0 subunit 9 [Viscum album]AHL69432.1 ATP synthase F0 subunit 9 [Viscum album]
MKRRYQGELSVSRNEMVDGAKSMGAGAATIALAGAAVGIGNVFSALIQSVARNPSMAKQSFGYAILGFALTEAIASFASMMAFLLSSVFQPGSPSCPWSFSGILHVFQALTGILESRILWV